LEIRTLGAAADGEWSRGTGRDAIERAAPGHVRTVRETALAACTAMDVDYIVGKRAEADSGWLRSSARKVRDERGNHLVDLELTVDLRYPEGDASDAARAALPMAVQRSNDRLCTVSRTMNIGTPVLPAIAVSSEPAGGRE